MPRLKALKPRVKTVAPRLTAPTLTPQPVNYGKGRGGRPWRRLVEAVKRRDQLTCQACGRLTEDGECDHIIPEAEGGLTEMANLQWLCRTPCHADKTKAEAVRGIRRNRFGGS